MNKIGAFWQKKDKNGNTYFSGIIDNDALPHIQKIPIVIFKNKNKQEEKHPDWIIYLSESQQKKEDDMVPF